MSQKLRKDGDVWMVGNESLARRIATMAMIASGLDAHNDFKTRDKIISAICPEIDSAIDVAIKSSIYALACESMARQFICPKMTGRELAESQLKGHTP